MILSIQFKNFRALRDAELSLSAFNLVVGPNGSGKTSILDAVVRLQQLARLPLADQAAERIPGSAEITFYFGGKHSGHRASLACVSDTQCDFLRVEAMDGTTWPASDLRTELLATRVYTLDHRAMVAPQAVRSASTTLAPDGANLHQVLINLAQAHPEAFAAISRGLCAQFVEYTAVAVEGGGEQPEVRLKLRGVGPSIGLSDLSQGTLYTLALLAIANDPAPASVIAIEEVDRGFHPRMMRQVLDVLHSISHPIGRQGAQVIATAHSPHLLDLFRDHPEEVILASKQGAQAAFQNLSAVPDLEAMLQGEGSLGDLWYAGVLGGIPEERHG